MSGLVYFIRCEAANAVKIGYTRSGPLNRLSALQTGCPDKLELWAHFPGTIDDERMLHEAFRPLHIHGEWFKFDGKLADLVFYLGWAERINFENALTDILYGSGMHHPDDPLTEEQYNATCDHRPFWHLIADEVARAESPD